MLINKILLISLSNVGDAIMTTPVLQALHNNYKNAIIDIVGDERSSAIFTQCPYIGEIYHKDKNKLFRGTPGLVYKLRKKRFDLIVDLRTDGLAYLLRAKKRLTKLNKENIGPHSVEQHMGVIHSICLIEGIPNCHIWICKNDKQFAEQTIGQFKGKQLLGIGLGANAQKKIWPSENYVALTNELRDKIDAVILLGNWQDRALSKTITTQSHIPTLDLCGRTSILQVAALMQHAMLFIGSDSGLGHIAAAMNTPSCTIFGPGDPERYRPWGDKAIWIKGQDDRINNITPKQVISLLNKCIFNIGHQQENNL